jgi:hypothetical protein
VIRKATQRVTAKVWLTKPIQSPLPFFFPRWSCIRWGVRSLRGRPHSVPADSSFRWLLQVWLRLRQPDGLSGVEARVCGSFFFVNNGNALRSPGRSW